MAIIRLQDKTPAVYTWESRDFQLLARLFDCSFNGVKYDIDSMLGILDAAKCRSNILQLVQTKLGFFPRREVEDDTLRCILQSFPLMVKSKGSLRSIQDAINTFLKAYGVTTEVNVWYVNESEVVYNTTVSDHTIIIGLNKALSNMFVLEEIFRYILPTGFGFYLYFYNTVAEVQEFAMKTKAKLLFASDNIGSMIRGNDISDSFVNRTLGGFDVTEIAGSDSVILTENGTYEPGDTSKFLGILTQEPMTSGDNYAYIKMGTDNYELYYKYNSKWNMIDYKGSVSSKPSKMSNGLSWTIINDNVIITGGSSSIEVQVDIVDYINKVGRNTNKFKYSASKNSWVDYSTEKEVNLEDYGIKLNLNGAVLTGSEVIEVFKNVTDNSIITDKNICNHYIWFKDSTTESGTTLNTKCLYDLYKATNKEEETNE